jgi:hypothetical protein
VTREAFLEKYADVFKGDEKWQAVETTDSLTYDWPATSTYVQNPPYFQGMAAEPGTISISTVRGFWRCWATWSPPTTSAPRGRSRRPPPPAAI